MKYICYLSANKVETLYSQISEFQPEKIQQKRTNELEAKTDLSIPSIFALVKGGLSFGGRGRREYSIEGEMNPLQKLNKIVEHLEQKRLLGDLNESINNHQVQSGKICYAYSGTFSCNRDPSLQIDQDYLEQENRECELPSKHWTGLRAMSRMTTLYSKFKDYDLVLAASYKYFSDMGGSRVVVGKEPSEDDLVSIGPHSGNGHFFAGHHAATFDTILFISGQRERTLFCSPLVIVNSFSPDLTL